jgi:hypothetical protein
MSITTSPAGPQETPTPERLSLAHRALIRPGSVVAAWNP